MAWLSGWSYKKTVTITGETGAGTNYQVNFSIGDAAGGDFNLESHCTSFPNDIQVTDNDQTTPLDYWVEDLTVDPISMWVEVADDLGINVDICVYYGKSGESSASDGTATFEFFDDFLGNSVDTNKWGGNTAQMTVANSILTNAPPDGTNWEIHTLSDFSSPTALRSKRRQNVGNAWSHIGFKVVDDYVLGHVRVGINRLLLSKATVQLDIDTNWTQNVWGVIDINWDKNTPSISWFENGSERIGSPYTTSTYIPIVDLPLSITARGTGGAKIYVDWVLTRKYASPEPAFLSAGSEESLGIGRLVYGGLVNTGLVGGRLTG